MDNTVEVEAISRSFKVRYNDKNYRLIETLKKDRDGEDRDITVLLNDKIVSDPLILEDVRDMVLQHYYEVSLTNLECIN